VAFELTARRLIHDDHRDIYDWQVAIDWDTSPSRSLMLRHNDRDRWSRQVRDFGVTRIDSILFARPEDRWIFATDCDL
jgi:hypothetical protein